jgi:hypothetical protein
MFKNKNSKKNYSTEIEKLQNGVRILEESKLDILEKNIDIKKVDRKIKKYKKKNKEARKTNSIITKSVFLKNINNRRELWKIKNISCMLMITTMV